MSHISARLGLPLLQPSQAQKHITHNEALIQLDALTQLVVEKRNAESPPAAPGDGQTYALGETPAGAWEGRVGMLVQWVDPAWLFYLPKEGWRTWDRETNSLCIYRAGDWQEVVPELENLPGLGIATTSDPTNRLAVSSEATLLSHAGGSHRLTLNKAGASDTATLLYQSGWTGHAELGLAGDTDFHLKVSSDGSTWTEAFHIEAATGRATGAAVQDSVYDSTEGRLLTVGAFGLGDVTAISQNDLAAYPQGFAITPFLSTVTDAPPITVNERAVVQTIGSNGGQFQNLFTRNSGQMWFRTGSGSLSDGTWQRVYHSANAVGTASHSGGLPTGSLIERGSNADGEYVRFADGTQICWHSETLSVTTTAIGAIFIDAVIPDWSFPKAFEAPPVVTISAQGGGGVWAGPGAIVSALLAQRQVLSATALSAETVAVVTQATGRWF